MVSLRISIPAEAPRGAAPLGEAGPAPTPTLKTLTGAFTLPEDAAPGASAGTLGGRTPGSTLSLADDAGGRVALAGTSIVRGATPLDHEAATSHGFTVRETLGGATNSPRDTAFTLAVTNIFEAPALAALSLSASTLAEGAAQGTAIGIIEGRTAGSSLALTGNAGGRFQLNGFAIEAGPTATDFEAATSHAITIRETLADSPNSPRDTVLTVAITEAEEPEPPAEAVTAVAMGQSEPEQLFNTAGTYRQIAGGVPGDGNLIVWTQNGEGNAPVRTVVDAASVAAGQVNPAMAAISAFLDYAAPGRLFVLGDGCVPGTGRYNLADDSTDATDGRLWGDFANVVDAIEAEFGPVGHLIECWYNSDAANISNFKPSYWPFYFGAYADGSRFDLGDEVNGRKIDHCLYDASADPAEKGRGLFARDRTDLHMLTPMPFHGEPEAPGERDNFSSGSPRPRLTEPDRATMLALAGDPLAQSVRVTIGPSAHITDFGGGIHPVTDNPDGQILFAWPFALALLRASGATIGEPTIVDIEGPADGSHVDLIVALPNGGNLTTLAALRGTADRADHPYQQAVTGIEITRADHQRRPVFRPDQTERPASHRGTVEIVDAGSGNPRRGRIRFTPEVPLGFGDTVSFLRGQGTAALQKPRDLGLYPWFPIEHVPALYDETATYPFEGIALRPYQADLPVPVEPPSFEPRAAYFDGESYFLSISESVPAGGSGMVSAWLRLDDPAWNTPVRRLFELRVGTATVLACYTAGGRLVLNLPNDLGNTTRAFWAAQPGNVPFEPARYYHVMAGWEPGGLSIHVDGQQVDSFAFGEVTMDGEDITRIAIGATAGTQNIWKGDIGHLYINLTETLDLSDPAERAKFIADGAPVDLGTNGQMPTGNAPAFYYDGDAPAWANQGTAGNVPLTGALTPSDEAPGLAG